MLCYGQRSSGPGHLSDGPFVFDKGNTLVVKSLKKGQVTTKHFSEAEKENIRLDVGFEAHHLPGFSVALKPRLLNEPCEFAAAEKMLVISDMEGEFEVLRSLLMDGGVIDKQYNWTFGSGHLVVVGDLFDRGKQVTQVLWLLYRLEDLAKAAGGYVHVVLGNHDIMNLSGDLRYVDKRYMDVAKALSLDYMQLYGRDTELGRWLRSKNVVEKIGDVLFTHGGISPSVNACGLSLQEINAFCRPLYDRPRKDIPPENALYFGKDGPFWYRGYFFAPKATPATVDSTLKIFGVRQIVVGHTITEGNVGLYYEGKVLGVDVDAHAGIKQAAFYDQGKWYKLENGRFFGLLDHSGWLRIKGPEAAVPVVFRDFQVRGDKKLIAARLSITALGLYQASINGQKIGDAYFTPGWTSYLNRLQYQHYQVTGLIRPGTNRLDVLLSGGWYSGPFGPEKKTGNYGAGKALNCKLVLEYSDGTREQVVSGPHWQVAASFIERSDFYDGEVQDTRKQGPDKSVMAVDLSPAAGFSLDSPDQLPTATLVRSISPAVKQQEVFKVVKSWKQPDGSLMLDFGQNMAGFVRIRIRGNAGDTLSVAHGEMLDGKGGLYTGNLRLAEATDRYILSGSEQVLEPWFTYHGFRYVRIRGNAAGVVKPGRVEAVALYSDLKPAGTFACSDTMLNQLHSNILWSMRSNFVDVPTDCPQRSERFGWTGDALGFVQTAAWNYDVLGFYRKYLADLAADQGANGGVPNIVPDFVRPGKMDKGGVAGWGDAAVLIPWRLYQVYGDQTVLEDQYESMKAWIDYLSSRSRDGLWKDKGYGDWYAQGDSTSLHFIDQCFYAYSSRLLGQAADVLGNSRDAAHYRLLSEQVTRLFADTYGRFDTPATSTQTAFLLALAFDLLPEQRRQDIAERLVKRIHQDGDRLATGFLGTPHLLPVLSRFGHQDLAYRLLLRREFPSWLYPLTRGATTVWEKWDAVRPDGSLQETSFNHFAYGAVGEWFYSDILGIKPAKAGFKQVVIRPLIGGGLKWAKGSYNSVNGRIGVSWRLSGDKVTLEVEIPAGMTAEVYVPGETGPRAVQGGHHVFKSNWR